MTSFYVTAMCFLPKIALLSYQQAKDFELSIHQPLGQKTYHIITFVVKTHLQLSRQQRKNSFFQFAVKPHKKKFSLSSPPASKFPAASIFFFICLIPHKNKVYGFVSVVNVVMN